MMSARPLTDFVLSAESLRLSPTLGFDPIRADGGIAWSVPMRRWIVASKDAAAEALDNKTLLALDHIGHAEKAGRLTGHDLSHLIRALRWTPFLLNGHEHRSGRQLFARIIADIRGEYLALLETLSLELLSSLAGQGPCDFAGRYAYRVHGEIIDRLMELPDGSLKLLMPLATSQTALNFMSSMADRIASDRDAKKMYGMLEAWVRSAPQNPMLMRIGRHLQASEIEDTPENRASCVASLLILGSDSFAGTMTLGLAEMLDAAGGTLTAGDLQNPSELVDDFFRVSSTAAMTTRIAAQDTQIAGQTVREGEILLIFLAAANRDETAFACPNSVGRGKVSHLAFGGGQHLCSGSTLARASVAIALRHLARFTPIRAVPGRVLGYSITVRRYEYFPLMLSEAA